MKEAMKHANEEELMLHVHAHFPECVKNENKDL
jgi:hypothetical protein